MAHIALSTEQIQVVLPPAAAPGLVMEESPAPTLTPEQVHAREAVFAHDPESEAVAGLWGMWAGSMMLHGVIVDAFADADEEDLDEEPKKQKPDPDEPQP